MMTRWFKMRLNDTIGCMTCLFLRKVIFEGEVYFFKDFKSIQPR